MGYIKYVQEKADKIRKEGFAEEDLPKPIHKVMLWGSLHDSGEIDVLYLIEYLESLGRDCHVNTGVHGKVTDGKFEFVWKGNDCEEFLRQDKENAKPTKNKVSLHQITKEPFAGPIYHAGVDTIDGFCKSWYKPLTEEELDKAFVEFCKV